MAGFLVGIAGHRACVNDINVGLFFKRDDFKSRSRADLFHHIGLVLVRSAAERVESYFWHENYDSIFDMRLKPFLIIAMIILSSRTTFCVRVPYPVIFVHGTGDSSVAWKTTGPAVSELCDKYYRTKGHPFFSTGSGIGSSRHDKNFSDNIKNSCVYVVFSDQYADPANLTGELKSVIDDTREETWKYFKNYFRSKDDIKVNLVCHSMGGLVARRYLVDHYKDHHVSKLILFGTSNNGIPALTLEWVPACLGTGGAAGFLLSGNPLYLSAGIIGIGWHAMSYARGVKLLSPATGAMKPDSQFFAALKGKNMPVDIDYVVILCSADDLMHQAANRFFGYSDGDGAISIDSQSLKNCEISNFKELKYRELLIKSSHFEEPTRAKNAVIKALDL